MLSSPLSLEHAGAELKFCTTLLMFQTTQFLPHPSKTNNFNQPKALLLRTAHDLRANCEFVILFYLFFYKTIWHSSENSLLSSGVCRFESAEGLGCKSCLWITAISCEVLRVGSAAIRPALTVVHRCYAQEQARFRKPSLRRGCRGGWRRGKVCWKPTRSSGRLAGYEGGWRSLGGGVLRTSLQTGLCRLLDVKAFQAHKPFSPSSTAQGFCGVDFEGYVCVGCVPYSQRRKG